MELLLAQKGTKQIFKSAGDSAQACKVNTAIKLSALWTDVDQVVSQACGLSQSNAAYALHRLGCLNAFASRKRKAGTHLHWILFQPSQTACIRPFQLRCVILKKHDDALHI